MPTQDLQDRGVLFGRLSAQLLRNDDKDGDELGDWIIEAENAWLQSEYELLHEILDLVEATWPIPATAIA